MPVYGKEEHDREMAAKAAATEPADLEAFELPERFEPSDRVAFARGVTAFRSGDFYLAHDLWEEVWHAYRPSDRLFLQGLIHVAVASYHVQCGNPRGANSQYTKALKKTQPYSPRHWGVDVEALRKRIERARATPLESDELAAALEDLRRGI